MHLGRDKQLRVALVTDWMTSFGGENRVLFELHQMFPEAPIYTTVYAPKELPMFKDAKVITSFLDKPPFSWLARKRFQLFLQYMPAAFEAFDFSGYDLVISSNHSCSKGIITNTDTLHMSYCHSPMRYAWENCHRYIRESAPMKNPLAMSFINKAIHKIRMWDRLAADRVDVFAANSQYIQRQIAKFYRRPSTVIYPPVETARFTGSFTKKDHFLAGGRLIANKRFDIIVDAFNETGMPLKIFGKGPEREKLMERAKANIEFLGFIPDEEVARLYGEARAFIVPQMEDFGIVTVEAMAAGTPIIGLAKGGTAELVIGGMTGQLMEEQTAAALVEILRNWDDRGFDPAKIRQHALKYDVARFRREIRSWIKDTHDRWIQSRTRNTAFDQV